MDRLHLILFILAALAVVSCVYDFHPEWQGQAGYVAIEGDIIVGDTCSFSVRFSTDLEDRSNEGNPLGWTLRVEADDGTVYPLDGGVVDLREADLSQQYRLVVDVTSPFRRTYASAWAPVQVSPPIDSLSWSIDDDKLWVEVSVHSDAGTGWYRWSASETWEYHATYYASYFFVLAGTTYKGTTYAYDNIVEFQDGENTFFCWKSAERSDILLGSTSSLSEDRLVDYRLFAFDPTDRRVSHVYSVELSQERISEDAYRYWEALLNNSSNVGGLFSPEPSELRGNIVNVDDPDELVLGYVSVSTRSRSRLFIENSKTLFSRWRGPSYGIEYLMDPREYRKYYGWVYRVGWLDEVKGWAWLPAECVDCRFSGGTKDRPSWWINDDK